MAGAEVQVVVAHRARATLRVGDLFLKVDPDRAGIDAEVAAMAAVAVPTPRVLWREHPVLALERVPGTALGTFGRPTPVGAAAWTAAGATVRSIHETPLRAAGGEGPAAPASASVPSAERLDAACAWFAARGLLPDGVLERNRRLGQQFLGSARRAFVHGDLQPDHVFVDDDDRVTGVIDWSGAGAGDPLLDLAVLTLGHPQHLGDVVAGYGRDVELQAVRAWWAYRCLTAVPWLAEHGFGPPETYPETAVLLRDGGARALRPGEGSPEAPPQTPS